MDTERQVSSKLARKRARKSSRKKKHHAPNRVSLQGVRISPRKVRVVIDMIRGMNVFDALRALKFTHKRAAPMLEKLIESALVNMEVSGRWNIDDVTIASAWVNEGPTMRRYIPRAMGRATRVLKRTSHIHLVLEDATAAEDAAVS